MFNVAPFLFRLRTRIPVTAVCSFCSETDNVFSEVCCGVAHPARPLHRSAERNTPVSSDAIRLFCQAPSA